MSERWLAHHWVMIIWAYQPFMILKKQIVHQGDLLFLIKLNLQLLVNLNNF